MLKRLLAPFTHSRSGVAALEFALIAPAMIVMLVGGVEVSSAITAANRATFIAETIGELVSRTKGPIGESEMAGFIKMAALIDPNVIRHAANTGKTLEAAVDVTVSSVEFSLADAACERDCTYRADVEFSTSLTGRKRPCGRLAPGSGSSPSTLPPEVFGPGSIVVVDVVANYEPVLVSVLSETISFHRSTFFRPRHVAAVEYAVSCPGRS